MNSLRWNSPRGIFWGEIHHTGIQQEVIFGTPILRHDQIRLNCVLYAWHIFRECSKRMSFLNFLKFQKNLSKSVFLSVTLHTCTAQCPISISDSLEYFEIAGSFPKNLCMELFDRSNMITTRNIFSGHVKKIHCFESFGKFIDKPP